MVELEAEFPAWQIWLVRIEAEDRTVWCARPWDGGDPVLNRDSDDHLAEAIREAEHEWHRRQVFPSAFGGGEQTERM